MRKRARAARPSHHRTRHVRFDGMCRHGKPWSRRNVEDAMRRCCGTVRSSDPASQPRQRRDSVRYASLQGPHRSKDSILCLSARLSKYGGGGTDCSIAICRSQHAIREASTSPASCWSATTKAGSRAADALRLRPKRFNRCDDRSGRSSKKTQRRHGIADPKLVCIDIQPYGTSQAPERDDILNIGGFSDAVFNVVSSFLENDTSRFVREVESVEL